jgi:hypothetical protein
MTTNHKEGTMDVKYPWLEVELTGQDGNAFAIVGNVSRAMRDAGIPVEQIDAYRAEAFAGDYDHLLRTTMAWVEVS